MPRNPIRDAQEYERRRNQLIEAGFRLFSTYGIESVSLQTVAEEAKVSPATMYNYYKNKVNLVVAISAKIWSDVWKDALSVYSPETLERIDAYRWVDSYTDVIIWIYQNKPEILRFSADYKTFVRRHNASEDSFKEQLDELKPVAELFHSKYEDAKISGCIRTDLPEAELHRIISVTMLAMAERYAQGIVWNDGPTKDYTKELIATKDMILRWIVS